MDDWLNFSGFEQFLQKNQIFLNQLRNKKNAFSCCRRMKESAPEELPGYLTETTAYENEDSVVHERAPVIENGMMRIS